MSKRRKRRGRPELPRLSKIGEAYREVRCAGVYLGRRDQILLLEPGALVDFYILDGKTYFECTRCHKWREEGKS